MDLTNLTLLDVIFLYVVLGLDLMFYKVRVISVYFCWQHWQNTRR